jgi:hypothetical protein
MRIDKEYSKWDTLLGVDPGKPVGPVSETGQINFPQETR